MGCGCGKKGVVARKNNARPTVGPRAIQGGSSAGATPAQLRSLGLQKSTSLGEGRKMDEQRRNVEKLRRDAIKKRLNK